MKNKIKVILICIFTLGIGGCQIMQSKETAHISEEHTRLCNSIRTKNKQLCERTMANIKEFSNDINTYFKEKFKLDGLRLTSLHFPYGDFDHGGFHATFQFEENPNIMLTAVFDYKDGRFQIRNITNEKSENSGQAELASAIVLSEFYKTIPISKIENDLFELGLSTNEDKRLYYYFDSGRYFGKRNIISSRHNFILLSENEQQSIIKQYQQNRKIQLEKHHLEYLQKKVRFYGLTYAENKETISKIFDKYMAYREMHLEYKEMLEPRVYYYKNNSDVIEKNIAMYINNEVEIHD